MNSRLQRRIAIGLFILGILPCESLAQISFGFQAGAVSVTDKNDPYGLDNVWQTKTTGTGTNSNNSQTDNSTQFFSGGTGSSILAHLTWEASDHIGLTLLYRTTDFKMTVNHRTATSNSLGVQFKVNFVKNTEKFVPFFQAEYMFMNSNQMTQNAATSTTHPTQSQPAYSINSKTALGIGGDLGLEFKLSQSLALVVVGGFHGIQASDGSENLSSLNYGSYYAPTQISGVFFAQFTGGLKYYVGKGKKKRDF
ncbi:MAG: hypothetical protein JST46_02550 [Bacteroidetes bacterium]|nr:hypothetical protein [Bacteroidota bacterium]